MMKTRPAEKSRLRTVTELLTQFLPQAVMQLSVSSEAVLNALGPMAFFAASTGGIEKLLADPEGLDAEPTVSEAAVPRAMAQ